MTWNVFTDSEPIARKDYSCDPVFFLSHRSESDFEGDDLLIYQGAKADNFMIKKV